MKHRTPMPLLLALGALLLLTPALGARTASNAQDAGMLLQVEIAELAPDAEVSTGMARTSIPAGGSVTIASGSGPAVHFVEAGEISIKPVSGEAPQVVPSPSLATPGADSLDNNTASAGEGIVLAAGSTVTLSATADGPATILDAWAATDASFDGTDGVEHTPLGRQQLTLPDAPVLLTLTWVTLAPGERLALPESPAVALYATVDRGKAFRLSPGVGINRSQEPLEVYILTIEPVMAAANETG